MNTHFRYKALIILTLLICLVFFLQTRVYAGHQNAVISSVNSARQQGVPEEILIRMLAYALDNRLDAEHTIHILSILTRVYEYQIPLNPFLDKIQEGLAKQINPQKLEEGLNKRIDDYKFVRQTLKKKYTGSMLLSDTVLTSLVESLGFGITRQELRLLIIQAPAVTPEMLAVAATNKALLRQLSFDDEVIDEILITGLKNKGLTPRWSLFFKVAGAAKKRGIPSARIAEVAKEVLVQNGNLEQVLTKLDFSSRDVKHGPHLNSTPNEHDENQ